MQPILAPHVRTFGDCLTDLPVQPSSVWLIGSQASGRAQAGSDTDLLVFGPPGLIDAIRATLSQPHGIDCMVLVNGDDFEDPWQEKGGSLSRWRWALKSATEAQYEGNKFIADEPGGSLGQFETRQERAHPHLVQLKASGMRVFPPEVRQARRPTSLAPMATSWINRAPLGHQTGEKMLLVYVDTGGMLKEVAALEAAGLLKTHYFPFEQRNRRVKAFVPGSGASWKQSNLSWKEAPGTWNDYKPSALFEPLRKLLGAKVDAQHLDSGVKAGCSVFLTSDKTDIWSKRDAIQALANIRVLHMPSELATLRQLANQG